MATATSGFFCLYLTRRLISWEISPFCFTDIVGICVVDEAIWTKSLCPIGKLLLYFWITEYRLCKDITFIIADNSNE